jgi:cold shock CspA family protein
MSDSFTRRASNDTTMRGALIWFNPNKRHGFIRTADGERLLVEESGFEPGHVPGERCRGMQVRFSREDAAEPDGLPRAIGVTLEPDSAPRRARLRHR